MNTKSGIYLLFLGLAISISQSVANPFLRPDQLQAKPPPVIKPAPPPPKPIPRNSNIEFRGYYVFQGEWHFALYDKSKNEGYWLRKGEALEGQQIRVENFQPENETIELSGGWSLSLIKSDGKVLPVPSSRPVAKAATTPKPTPPKGNPVNTKPTSSGLVKLPAGATMGVPRSGIPRPNRTR